MKTFICLDKWGHVDAQYDEWRELLEEVAYYEPDAPSQYSSYVVDEDLVYCLEVDFELREVHWHTPEDIRNAFEEMHTS